MVAFFAKHPTAANLMMAVLIIMGIVVYPSVRRETFPDITPGQISVTVNYAGATAEEVEEAICQRIEDAVDGIENVREVVSDAREGLASVTVEMQEGGDIDKLNSDVKSEIEAINDFPDDIEDPVISKLGRTDQVLDILVSGDLDPIALKAYCEELKDKLQRLGQVSLVELSGFSDHQFRVELDAQALLRFNLSAKNVADAIAAQNVSVPAGGIESNDQDLLVRMTGQRRSPAAMEQLVVKAADSGAEILLGDIASIVDVFELDEQKTLHRDRRACKLSIQKTKQQDTIRVANAVKEFLVGERERYPQLSLFVSSDSSTLISDRIALIFNNGLQGMVLVFLTLWLFFNWRLSFWVAMSLPVSVLGALALMPMFGMTINIMTSVGMLMAIGLLMDDGIVIAENIASHRAKGKTGIQAAIDGIVEVQAGVFSSFITTACVLGPLAFQSGDIGTVLGVVPIVLLLVLGVSLIEAFFILPSHLGHSLAGHGEHEHDGEADTVPAEPKVFFLRRWFDNGFDWFRETFFGAIVDSCIRWRYLAVGSTLGLLLAAVSLLVAGIVRFEVFPSPEGDSVSAKLTLAAGTPLHRTEAVVAQITDALNRIDEKHTPEQPGQQNLVASYSIDFNTNSDAYETGPHVATISVDLLSSETRTVTMATIIKEWTDEVGALPDVLALTIAEPAHGPAGKAIEVRVQGDDLEELKQAATESINWFRTIAGVRNLADDLRQGKPELRINIRPGAYSLGLDANSMATQLRATFQGIVADEIQIGPESYEIDVRLERDAQNNLDDLESFQFVLADGKQIPLETVADIQRVRGWSRIARVNGRRTVTVFGDTDSSVVSGSSVVSLFKKDAMPELAKKFPSVQFGFEGESAEGSSSANSMLTAMLIGLIGVFVLLSFQFRSYIEPLIVMLAIPLALIGVIVGHWLVGISFTMPSMLGFISLAGIVVNDSILLVLFLKAAIEGGDDTMQAARQASRQRFRAILLTSATTVAGLLPLIFETSLQAQTLIPLAVSIAFGIMASTGLVLIVIPCIYVIKADLAALWWRFTGKQSNNS